jgi:hypothetical protein
VDRGEPIRVSYRTPDADGSVAIVPAGGDVGSSELTESLSAGTGSFDVETEALSPGAYEAVLVAADGVELARVGIWIRDPDAVIQVTTDAPTYEPGEPIIVSWTDGPANRWDWVGIYEAAKSDPMVDYYLLWNYTGLHDSGTVPPAPSGSMTMDATAQGSPWPLPPGEYVVHYLLTDRYRSAGSARFEVVG